MELLEIFKVLQGTNSLVTVGSAVAAALLLIAYKLSWIKPRKTIADSVEGAQIDQVGGIQASYQRQIDALDARVADLSQRMDEMSQTIHDQQIRITRLQVLVIQLQGMLAASGITIPQQVKDEIAELLEPKK